MTILRRIGYALCSTFYALSAGYFLAAGLTVIRNGGPVKSITEIPFFRVTYLLIGLLIVSLQLLRIELSYRRHEEKEKEPKQVSFVSGETNLQFWFGLVGIVGLLLGAALSVVE